MDENKKVSKYMTLYMSLGLCMGMSLGLTFGLLVFDNLALGLSLGLSIGMSIGIALGTAKDKRLSEHMMEVKRIDEVPESSDLLVYAMDKDGTEKEYRVTEKQQKIELFAVGDRVAEEKNGTLVSLETKEPEVKKKKQNTK